MKFAVIVKTKSKTEGVERLEDGSFIVRVNVPPVEGKANKRVIELLSKRLGVPKTRIQLVGGQKSKKKLFELLD